MILGTIIIGGFHLMVTRLSSRLKTAVLALEVGLLARPVIGRAETADQACPSNRQDHLLDQNDPYAHDA